MWGIVRYPDSKSTQSALIASRLRSLAVSMGSHEIEYRELFVGSGATTIKFLENPGVHISRVRLNDTDIALLLLWTAIIHAPEKLVAGTEKVQPSLETFNLANATLRNLRLSTIKNDADAVTVATMKIALHQMSFDRRGGNAGISSEQAQVSVENTHARWNARSLGRRIRHASVVLRGATVTGVDFEDVLDLPGKNVLMYLDPPRYMLGQPEYVTPFTPADHLRLAHRLRESRHQWLLTVRDCPEIRSMYEWASIELIGKILLITK